MGFLSRLRARYSTTPTTMYRATIRTTHGTHPFVYITGPGIDEAVIVTNRVGFEMPEDPTFVKIGAKKTELQGKAVRVVELEGLESDANGDRDTVTIPGEFRGETIPEVDRSKVEIEQLPIY